MRQSKRRIRPADKQAALRALIRRHRVYWEVRPEPILDEDDAVVNTGFQLGLRGTFENPDHPLDAGSPECVEVYRNLRKIAEGILPEEDPDPNYRISVFENAIDYTPSSGRKDIEVMIKVVSDESRVHVDPDELQTIRELKQKLKDLGAPQGRWRESALKVGPLAIS